MTKQLAGLKEHLFLLLFFFLFFFLFPRHTFAVQTYPYPPGTMVYVAHPKDNETAIYTARADGSQIRRLSPPNSDDWWPNFSKDGKTILFTRTIGQNSNLYRMKRDGTNVQQLTNDGQSGNGIFTPDGTSILFTAPGVNNPFHGMEIFAMDSNGNNRRQLTFGNTPFGGMFPAVSSDGQTIAFMSDREGGNMDIYTMNRDGTNSKRLTSGPTMDTYPTFSPDGTKIAYATESTSGNLQLGLMQKDGQEKVVLATNLYSVGYPSFSPSGKYILFTADPHLGTGTRLYFFDLTANGGTFSPQQDNLPKEKSTALSFTRRPGDVDDDTDVDIFDYNIMITNFGQTICNNLADIDDNCKVDIFDYNILISNFGK